MTKHSPQSGTTPEASRNPEQSTEQLRGKVVQLAQQNRAEGNEALFEMQKEELQENIKYLSTMLGANDEHGVYQKGTLETYLEQVCPYDAKTGKMPEYPIDPAVAA
jgi:hypothetical protein